MQSELFLILSGGYIVKYWVKLTRQAMQLYVEVLHLGVSFGLASQFVLMPVGDFGLDQESKPHSQMLYIFRVIYTNYQCISTFL